MLKILNVSKVFKGEPVLGDVSFVIDENEKVGLIGPNGCGKTTLLKIILGEIESDTGVVVKDKTIKIGYLPQLCHFDYQYSAEEFLKRQPEFNYQKFISLCKKLRIQKNFLKKICVNLSEGEKTKLMIFKLLLENPTVLLLDEPTNNLDIEEINIEEINVLSQILNEFKGALLLVTHDRWLLDKVVNKIISLEPSEKGRISIIYPGNFSAYEKQKELEYEKKLINYKNWQKEIERLKKEIRESKIKALKLKKSFRKKKSEKKIGIMDLSKEVKVNRHTEVLEKRLENLLKEGEFFQKRFEENKHLWRFSSFLPPGQRVMEVKSISFGFDKNNNIINNLELSIYGNDRIALVAPNGEGKTTILKILMGEIKNYQGKIKINPSVKIGYLPQEVIFDNEDLNILEWFKKLKLEVNFDWVRRILGQLGITQYKQGLKIRNLSAGEKRKLYLAKIIANGDNAIFLDEPTNHLDIESIETMEDTLKSFKGALFVISHDRYFLKNIKIDYIYNLYNGQLVSVVDIDKI